MKKNFTILVLSLNISSCTTTKKYTELKKMSAKPIDCKVDIYMIGQQIDKKTETIGVFNLSGNPIGETCEIEDSINRNKKAACEAGADAVKYTFIHAVSKYRSCYETMSEFLIYK